MDAGTKEAKNKVWKRGRKENRKKSRKGNGIKVVELSKKRKKGSIQKLATHIHPQIFFAHFIPF